MNETLIDKIVQAVLYEGYILYPYRRSTKNHHRWTFGTLFPRDFGPSEPHVMQTQCIVRAGEGAKLSVKVRFLQLVDRQVMRHAQPIDQAEIGGKQYQTWQEAFERTITLELDLADGALKKMPFHFPFEQSTEIVAAPIALVRTKSPIEGVIELSAKREREDLYQLTLRTQNLTPLQTSNREQALRNAMASTHAILSMQPGEFISIIDPPGPVADLAKQCKNISAWPVLVGDAGATDAMLASPIILYDYPQLAPESPGDLFDGTEIDEILSLRIMTMTDEEKHSAEGLDDRSAAMLRRTESLARDQLQRLHGTMRSPPKLQAVHVADAELRPGDHVRLRPSARADAFDIILRGKTATIAAIEQDFENRIHLAVTIDDDPGADIGAAGKIGHRFYFGLNEVEPIHSSEGAAQ